MTDGLVGSSNLALRESLARGEVAAFIGAWLSLGAGLPGWYSLVEELATRIELIFRRKSGSQAIG
jgi:hypothetical protein